MSESELLPCPFCKEKGFDRIGLKIHFQAGYCDVFNSTECPAKTAAAASARATAIEECLAAAKRFVPMLGGESTAFVLGQSNASNGIVHAIAALSPQRAAGSEARRPVETTFDDDDMDDPAYREPAR